MGVYLSNMIPFLFSFECIFLRRHCGELSLTEKICSWTLYFARCFQKQYNFFLDFFCNLNVFSLTEPFAIV